MNRDLLRRYISEYEKEFVNIHNKEIYKWRAVKQFQDAWNPVADDFSEMLALALSKTDNLMAAWNYFPREMIVRLANERPQTVKDLFLDLFDEETDLLERIDSFQKKIKGLNENFVQYKNHYQDDRAVLVYLSLRFPETYFFYKFKMFKAFCEKVDAGFEPKIGRKSNIVQFLETCQMVREEIRPNNHLLKLYTKRIGDAEYFDEGSNILTQDFIYAVTKYLSIDEKILPIIRPGLNLQVESFEVAPKNYPFKAKYVDHVARQRRNKRIGDLGEQIVLQDEKERCPADLIKQIDHSSKSKGDGLGYDILSFDEKGNPKFIEVKSTTGGRDRPFFVTGAELARSKKEGSNYFLYRLYNLNERSLTADYFIIRGDLSEYCTNPIEFEVILKPIILTSP